MNSLTDEYFQTYRDKIAECELLRQEIRNIEKIIYNKNDTVRSLEEEINAMRQLITIMIDNDWDPVEAKLKTEAVDRMRNMWHSISKL